MTTELQPIHSQVSATLEFTPEQVDLIKRTICDRQTTNDELKLFLYQCKTRRLDPLAKQCYAIRLNGKLTLVTSIDGFRSIANRSGVYAGQLGAFWCGTDGVWKDVWLDSMPPSAAKVAVLRSDFKEPLWAVARWESYAKNTSIWKTMPDLMLAKTAESLALRRAFPEDLGGMYTSEEIGTEAAIEIRQEKEIDHEPNQAAQQLPTPQTEVQKTEEIKRPTEPQLIRLYTIASTRGWNHDAVLSALKKRFGIESAKLLTLDQYNNVIAGLETLPEVQDDIRH